MLEDSGDDCHSCFVDISALRGTGEATMIAYDVRLHPEMSAAPCIQSVLLLDDRAQLAKTATYVWLEDRTVSLFIMVAIWVCVTVANWFVGCNIGWRDFGKGNKA